MTDFKALPAPMTMLALPNYSYQEPDSFIDETYIDSFLKELTVFISDRAEKMRAEKVIVDQLVCKKFILEAAAKNSRSTAWSDVLEGASLAFNPFPLRKPTQVISDAEAIRGDWLTALADANKVWHTINVCIPKSLKPDHERSTRSTSSTTSQRPR